MQEEKNTRRVPRVVRLVTSGAPIPCAVRRSVDIRILAMSRNVGDLVAAARAGITSLSQKSVLGRKRPLSYPVCSSYLTPIRQRAALGRL